MANSLRGLRKAAKALKGCKDPAAQKGFQEARKLIQELENALKGIGI